MMMIRVVGPFSTSTDVTAQSIRITGPVICKGKITTDNLRMIGPFRVDADVHATNMRIIGPVRINGELKGETSVINGPLKTTGMINIREELTVKGPTTAPLVKGKIIHLLGGIGEIESIEASQEVVLSIPSWKDNNIKSIRAPVVILQKLERKGILGLIGMIFRLKRLIGEQEITLNLNIEAEKIIKHNSFSLLGSVNTHILESLNATGNE